MCAQYPGGLAPSIRRMRGVGPYRPPRFPKKMAYKLFLVSSLHGKKALSTSSFLKCSFVMPCLLHDRMILIFFERRSRISHEAIIDIPCEEGKREKGLDSTQ